MYVFHTPFFLIFVSKTVPTSKCMFACRHIFTHFTGKGNFDPAADPKGEGWLAFGFATNLEDWGDWENFFGPQG